MITEVEENSFLLRIGRLEKSLINARYSSLSTCRAFDQLCCRKALPCTIVFISVNRVGKLCQVLEEVLLQLKGVGGYYQGGGHWERAPHLSAGWLSASAWDLAHSGMSCAITDCFSSASIDMSSSGLKLNSTGRRLPLGSFVFSSRSSLKNGCRRAAIGSMRLRGS